MERFNLEEINLISIYAEDSKQDLIENMTAALAYTDNEMSQLIEQTICKLEKLSAEEFEELAFIAADEI